MVVVVAAAAILTGSTVAHAAPAGTAQQKGSDQSITASLRAGVKPAFAPDGNLYIYSDDMGRDVTYSDDRQQWPGGWHDKVDQLWNNGFPGGRDDVNIYAFPWHNGAYACIGNGHFWDLRNDEYVFSWIKDGASDWQREPLGDTVHDDGSGHKWVTHCGNNT